MTSRIFWVSSIDFTVDVSSVFCLLFVYYLSMFAWFSVDILPVFCPYCVRSIAHVHRNQHKPALYLRIRPPKIFPLLVSYRLLDVSTIVSWLNVISSDRTCTVNFNSIKISQGDLKKWLYVLCRFCCRCLLGFLYIFFYCLSIFALFSVNILSVFCPYYRACSQGPAQARSMSPDSSTQKVVPLIVSSHLLTYRDRL